MEVEDEEHTVQVVSRVDGITRSGCCVYDVFASGCSVLLKL